MSIIPIQTLIIDNDTDIGLTSDLINGTYKTFSLTDLSNNVYARIFDLSSNLNTTINTKENILSFNGPLSKSSNTVSIDLSNYAQNTALSTLNASNFTSGTLSITRGGIGTTTLSANQILIGNSNTSILQSANLTWNNTSNTLSASNFVGSGTGLTALNASNFTSGTLSITRGGIGTTTLSANQILIGNSNTSILQSANLTWNNTSNTLSASNFVGSGTGLTALNASYITSGTLSITRGGIGTTTLNNNQILIGNSNTSILQSANLTWNNTSNTLSASNFVGSGSGISSLNASNITSGTLSITCGGIGTTTLLANQILIGNSNTSILQSTNLTWNNTSNTLSASNFVGSGSGLTSINASNVSLGTLSISRGGIGTTTLLANQILIGNSNTSILQSANLTWNNTSNTLSASNFVGSGSGISSLNASNVESGTLSITRGGIGTTTLSANQILIGNSNTSILQSANLTWNNTSNTLSASNFVGSGSGLTSINASNVSLGTLSITRGGIGTTTLSANQILIGNSNTSILQSANLTWNNTSNTLSASNFVGSGSGMTNLDYNNISINKPDLTLYAIKTNVDASLNSLSTNKQNNLTFSDPFLNTSNTISLKLNSSQFNIDSNGNLNLISNASSQWITSGSNIYYNTGNVGIGKTPSTALDVSGNIISSGTMNINGGVLYINGAPSSSPGSNGYTCLWNQSGVGPTLSGYQISLTTGTTPTTERMRIDNSGIISCTGKLIVGNNNSYPDLQLGSTNGNNIGIATTAASFSTSSAVNDMVIRSLNRLILQSGSGGYGILIDATNNININNSLTVGGTLSLKTNQWHQSNDGVYRFFYDTNGITYFHSGNTSNAFVFRSFAQSDIVTISNAGNITCTGTLNVSSNAVIANNINISGNTNAPQSLFFRSTDYNLGIAGAAGNYSSSAIAGDMILRTLANTNLYFQSGSGSHAFKVATNNYCYVNKKLHIDCIPSDNRATVEASILATNPTISSVFGGDNIFSAYWGCAINLNASGYNNGYGGANNTQSYIPGYSAFTVNMRTSTTATSFDKNLLTIMPNGKVGIGNVNPLLMLHLGSVDIANSFPMIVFSKNYNYGFRNAYLGYNDSFYFVIGDYGNSSVATNNTLTSQLAVLYSAPTSSLVIQGSGFVAMQYGYGNGSDERIKSNIKTIENALDKTLLLRGVEFNLNIEPERKRIGLIAQEVELIIPEVVRTAEDDGLKSIEYQNLVGLLVEAIKELNNKVTNLENILKNNNLI